MKRALIVPFVFVTLLIQSATVRAAEPKELRGTPHIDQQRLDRLKSTKMPAFDQPLAFNTPDADAILSALEIFPPDNPWNIPVDQWPVATNSAAMIAAIGPTK